MERAAAAGLDHVVFAPEQPRELIPSLLASADASVVPLKVRRDTHTVPSKMFESLGAGKPVLVSLDGEAAEIARSSGGALVTPPEDATALADALALMNTFRNKTIDVSLMHNFDITFFDDTR